MLKDHWMAANPIARLLTYIVAGVALGLILRVVF